MVKSRVRAKHPSRWLAQWAWITAGFAAASGCLSRPVGSAAPNVKENFTTERKQRSVDKVDLLFMIDNSASMGDKQEILAEAVPVLLERLLRPKCVSLRTGEAEPGAGLADAKKNVKENYGCPGGTEPEFRPITDMHIGVVSSSLGGFGGSECSPDNPLSTPRSNDGGKLVALNGTAPAPDAQPTGFLAWFPESEENQDPSRHPRPLSRAFGDTTELANSFQATVRGVGQNGCGLEAQLESWYRFLIQPDPWVQVALKKEIQGDRELTKADLGDSNDPKGVDYDVLKQRADFLRPDSLVAVILLTDEDDSSVDPLALGGGGWSFMNNSPRERATRACANDPASAACTSCAYDSAKTDSECQEKGVKYGAGEDDVNARFGHQLLKRRYGVDPQYPLSRYVMGLTKPKVPNRAAEHRMTMNGTTRSIAPYDREAANCTNPLFAASLPRKEGDELCNLPVGVRSPDLVFFAVVGGVPPELLHFDPSDPVKSRITEEDWVKILGRKPEAYDFTGIDPHMVQSRVPRPGLPAPTAERGANGPDPIHGREWDTAERDLQYACTFALRSPRTCPRADNSCDCDNPNSNPPLCGTAPRVQTRAKAYPTVRELMVARALGEQGVIASLCANLNIPSTDDRYGYNPAVISIVDRLKDALTTQCLPRALKRDATSNEVPCLVLAQLASEQESCDRWGLAVPGDEILSPFRDQQRKASGDVTAGGVDLSKRPVCVLPQLVVSPGATCKNGTDKGWCYVENSEDARPAGRCSQALLFSSATAALSGATFHLQCIQQNAEEGGAAGAPAASKASSRTN